MEGATEENDIEMASGTSAAETMIASSSNNQGESFNSMGLEHYSAAAVGDFEKFKHSDSEDLVKILTPNGNTILHIHITALPPPGSRNFVREILGMCPYLLWKANKKGETLLHMAARHGHADVVIYLLEECKNIPYKNQYYDPKKGIKPTRTMLQMTSHDAKDTALHEAVRYDHLYVVQLLTLEDRGLTYETNAVGETPLYLTAERGNKGLLKEILRNCSSPGDLGPYDRTALHIAVIRKDEEMVETLLQAGEGIHKSKQDQYGWTPLHFAAYLGYIKIMEKLLSKEKSAAYKADNKGKTALHVAAGHGRVDIMRKLISKCPDCCELVDERGRNVLHFALESRNKKAIELVLENPWLGNLINERDKNGNTPLLHAASIGYYHMRHSKVDMQVFNHQNHNAMDIILGNNTTSLGYEIKLDRSVWLEENCKYRPGLRMIVSENDSNIIGEGRDKGNTVRSKSIENSENDSIGEGMDKGNTVRSKSIEEGKLEDEGKMSSKNNDGKRKDRSISNIMDKARENELIAATLIATVTFAAGFTVPGGYVADKGPDQGAAILTRNIAFRAFVILNTMSMFFSCQAVMFNLDESSFALEPDIIVPFDLSTFPRTLITYAMGAMIGAFLSGTYAVLHSDKYLAIGACVVPFGMFSFLLLTSNLKFLLLFYSKMYQLFYRKYVDKK